MQPRFFAGDCAREECATGMCQLRRGPLQSGSSLETCSPPRSPHRIERDGEGCREYCVQGRVGISPAVRPMLQAGRFLQSSTLPKLVYDMNELNRCMFVVTLRAGLPDALKNAAHRVFSLYWRKRCSWAHARMISRPHTAADVTLSHFFDVQFLSPLPFRVITSCCGYPLQDSG